MKRKKTLQKKVGIPDGLLGIPALAKRFGRNRVVCYDLLRDAPVAAMAGKRKLYRPEDVAPLLTGNGHQVGRELRNTLVEEQTRKLKLANDLKAGKVVAVAQIANGFLKVSTSVKKILRQRLENEYPTFCAGLQVAEARVYGKRLADEIIKEFAALESAWSGKPE